MPAVGWQAQKIKAEEKALFGLKFSCSLFWWWSWNVPGICAI